MYDIMEASIIDMLKQIKNDNCCENPTCGTSLTPPFLEPAKCRSCGEICSKCDKVNNG